MTYPLCLMRAAFAAAAILPSAASAAITISAAASEGVDCSGGVCSPTVKAAVLNVTDLENLLAAGNVEVTTTGSDAQADDINVTATLSWSGTNLLALDAHHSITVSEPVSITGFGGLSLSVNDGTYHGVGSLSFEHRGNVNF